MRNSHRGTCSIKMVRVEEAKGFLSVSPENMKEVMQKRKAERTALPTIRTVWYTSIPTGIGKHWKGNGKTGKDFPRWKLFPNFKIVVIALSWCRSRLHEWIQARGKCGSEETHDTEGLPGVRRSVKHPGQIQVHQTFQQIQVGMTCKPILEIWKLRLREGKQSAKVPPARNGDGIWIRT